MGADEALYSVIEAATVGNVSQLNLAPANCQRGSEERKNDISEVRGDVWKTMSTGPFAELAGFNRTQLFRMSARR